MTNCTKLKTYLSIVAHDFSPSAQKTETSGSLSSRPVWSKSEFQDRQGCIVGPCLKTRHNKTKNCPREGILWAKKGVKIKLAPFLPA